MKKINMKSIVFGEIIMKKINMKKRFGFIGTLMVVIVALTGVAHADGHLKFPIGEGEFSWDTYHDFAMEHDYSGQQLTVTTRFAGEIGDNIYETMKYFAEATGADVRHNGTQNFKQEVTTNLEAGSPANVTAFSLVGFLAGMAKRGFLNPLDDDIADYIRNNYAAGDSWIKYGTAKGPDGKDHFYGVVFQTYINSLIYYVPENWEDAGYEIPKTMEELEALIARIVADGEKPWCDGLFAEGSTGFTAQTFMAEYLLRTEPIEVYDMYDKNEIPVDDPRIVAALEGYGEMVANEKNVADFASLGTASWITARNGIFTSPPKCYMTATIGSYLPGCCFPKDKEYGDWDFFYMPTKANRPDLPKKPIGGGGHFFTITKDSPVARGFIRWLLTPIASELWMAQGGFLTAHKHANNAVYRDKAMSAMNQLMGEADPWRYNVGETMPAPVGGGALNKAMVDYVNGEDAAVVLRRVQEVWDKNK